MPEWLQWVIGVAATFAVARLGWKWNTEQDWERRVTDLEAAYAAAQEWREQNETRRNEQHHDHQKHNEKMESKLERIDEKLDRLNTRLSSIRQ